MYFAAPTSSSGAGTAMSAQFGTQNYVSIGSGSTPMARADENAVIAHEEILLEMKDIVVTPARWVLTAYH